MVFRIIQKRFFIEPLFFYTQFSQTSLINKLNLKAIDKNNFRNLLQQFTILCRINFILWSNKNSLIPKRFLVVVLHCYKTKPQDV